MKSTVTIILSVLFLSISVQAQSFNFDVGFALGTPEGSFSQELDRNSYGADVAFTYQLPQSPFHIGIGFGYQNFGWKERLEYFDDNIREVDVRVRTTNNMVTPQLLMRFEPSMGIFSPFVEGSLGMNYLYTETSVIDDWTEEEIAGNVNYDYTTSNFGIGGGMKIKLYEGYDDDGDFFGVSLIAKTKYMVGGEALYLKEGGLTSTNRGLNYDVSRSRTDLRTFNVGFAISF